MHLSESLKNKNCADEVAILYRNSYSGHVVNFLASTVLAFAFNSDEVQQVKLIWWAVMTALITYRFIDSCHWTFFLDGQIDPDKSAKLKNKFLGLVVATALVWATYPLFMFPHFSLLEYACTAIIYASLAGGSVTILAAHKLAAMCYCVALIMPMSVLSLLSHDQLIQVLGGMGCVYVVVILFTADRTSKFTTEAIELKNQNAELLVEVNLEKELVKESNHKLKQALETLHSTKESLKDEVNQRTRQIVKLNKRDSLTGLLNRKAIREAIDVSIDEGIRKSTRFALLFVDLNGFKKINDTLGHEIGDQALKQVSDCLLELDLGVRSNVAIGRWGGDEFVVLKQLEQIKSGHSLHENETECNVLSNEAIEFAQQIKQRIRSLRLPGHSVSFLDAAIGISYFPKHSIQADELLRQADIAMFEHKHADNGIAVEFRPEFQSRIEATEALRRGLNQAIEKDQLFLLYQPIVNTGMQKIIRYEALIRWQFGDKMVSPLDFISIAEQSGQIIQIGAWVLNQACKSAMQWQTFHDSGVSVNVSTVQLLDENFVNCVKVALTNSGLPPSKLNLEITESLICSDIVLAKKVLEEIKKLGVTIAIDDFGTGYSSLSQIGQLPINCVKVDRHFVANMKTSGGVILRAATMIAREMSLNIVAEGVEDPEQLNALQAIGIETFQGYFFAKPLPEHQIEHYASQWLNNMIHQAS